MKDSLLTTIISLAEGETPTECDVTLIVGGFLVSGFVVSADKYMKNHAVSEIFWDAVNKYLDELEETNEPTESDEPQDTTPNFIHLRDAKYYAPGGNPIPGNMGVYCRIPLTSVHGFSFGLLSADNP